VKKKTKLKVAANIESLVPYPPGKPLEELERELGISGSIKLASNENAWGPSPMAVAAIKAALSNLHRYPDGSCYYLSQALAGKLGISPDQIVFGNGSNEIIGLLINAFMQPGEEVITSHPTFLMYQKMVQAANGSNRTVALKDMRHDLEGILAALSDKTRLIFLDVPNNPTGTIVDQEDFDNFLSRIPDDIIVVLDEAYVDFAPPAARLDTLAYINKNSGGPSVVALRTFSKAYGLAGLRIGYGLMSPEIAGYLHRVRQPFNVNYPAQVGAVAALADDEYYQQTIDRTRQGLAWLSKEIEKMGLKPFPSNTNFFLVDLGMEAKGPYHAMLRKGVIVRPMQAYSFPNFIRITVGKEEENQRLVTALAQTLAELANG